MRGQFRGLLVAAAFVGFAVTGCSFKAGGKMSAGANNPPPPPPAATPAAPAPAAPKPTVKSQPVKAGAIELPYPIQFETGTAKLKPESDAPLEVVKQYIESKPEITKMRVEGHTDTVGSDADNLKLSQDRANAVAKWLVDHGVKCERLVPVGFGETKLLKNPEKTPEDQATNRRVMFLNAEMKGKAVMGMPLDGGAPSSADACKL